jgi:hypothetical protein
MTRVAELEHAWREVAGKIDSREVSWNEVAQLSERSLDLGEDLIRTPASELKDVAIKLKWLVEQDLDRTSYKNALRCVLRDLERVELH